MLFHKHVMLTFALEKYQLLVAEEQEKKSWLYLFYLFIL